MWEPETLDLQELGEHEAFDFESSGEFDMFGDLEGGASWENGSDLFNDYESVSGISLEELEGDPFLGDLVSSATRTLNRVSGGIVNDTFLKNLARQAATVAGGAIAGQQGARIAGQVANQVIRETESGAYYENGNYEAEIANAGIDMEAYGDLHFYANQIAEAESEAEADEFLGALLPVISQVAAPLVSNLLRGNREFADPFDEEGWSSQETRDEFLPALLPLLPMVAPLISKGVGAIGQMLSKGKKSRRFAGVAPKIATAAAAKVAQQAASGRPPTPQRIAATVASEAAREFSDPRKLRRTMQQNRSIAQRAGAGSSRMASSTRRPTGTGSRPTPPMRGRAPYGAQGMPYGGQSAPYGSYSSMNGSRGRPQIIGYLPVYAKR